MSVSPTLTTGEATAVPIKRFKMELLADEFLVDVSGNNGRFPRGSVLLVDQETAIRWYERNIAEIAPPEAVVFGEIQRRVKKEEFLRRAVPVEGVFDKAITTQSFQGERPIMPKPMPTPTRARRGRPDLEGAEVVTDLSDDE